VAGGGGAGYPGGVEWLAWAFLVVFAVFGVACLFLVALGLPGTWVLLATAVGIELLDAVVLGDAPRVTFGWQVLAIGGVLGLVGEAVEFVAGVAGARLGGSTRRGMWGALIGGLLGAIVFTPLVPAPLLGSLVGALVGTFLGAWIGEATGPVVRSRRDNLRAGLAAVAGRLAGTLGKLAAGVAMWALLARALWPGG